MASRITRLAALAVPALLAGCAANPSRVHESLLTLDSHLDTPMLLEVQGWDVTARHDVAVDGTQVDLPRAREGGLDGAFWATFIGQGPLTEAGRAAALEAGLNRINAIRAMIAAHPDSVALALTPDDAPRIAASGRHFVYLSMENGYPLGEHPEMLERFHALGLRMASPVHFQDNDLATAAAAQPRAPGLTALGEQWVREANRLGILIDASHASDEALDRILELSTAPIILSHSGARAVSNHPRNLTDEQLRRIAAKGGVVQVLAYSDYFSTSPVNPQRRAAITAARAAAPHTEEGLRQLQEKLRAIDAQFPAPRASFEDFMAHLLHVIRVAGVEHAGIGLDFDGGGGVTGLDQASDYPKITARLMQEGYSKRDLQKIWSGNALRALGEAQRRATR